MTVTFLQGKYSIYGVQRARVWGKIYMTKKKKMKKNEEKNTHKRQLLKQNNLRPDGEAEGLGTGKSRCLPIPGAFPAHGRLRQAGASGVAGPGPQGAAGRPPLSISICHSFSYLGTKGPNFLLQMCSSMSNRGGTEENLLPASWLFLKQLRAIL